MNLGASLGNYETVMPSNTMCVYWMLSLEYSPKLQQISPLQTILVLWVF
jgi:hypothetical protein